MDLELENKIKKSIKNIEEKENKIYFFVQDTKGNARAAVDYIYNMANTLKTEGYNVIMLHEKNDYVMPQGWFGDKYLDIPHQSVEGTNLEIAPEDIMVMPEIFGFVMEQIKNLPCGKIVIAQAYDHVIETLSPGQSWSQLGFFKCITTSEVQAEEIKKVMKKISFTIIPPVISERFKKQVLPSKPIIGIHSREQRDSINLIKQFYLKYPQYRFFTFRDLRGLSQEEFSQALQDIFLGVWIDPTSGFGTFPLECMKSGVITLGKIPNLKPEWMNEKNGIWLEDQLIMVDVIADIIQTWLEDSIVEDLYVEGEKTASMYSDQETFKSQVLELFSDFSNKRKEAFEAQLNPEISK